MYPGGSLAPTIHSHAQRLPQIYTLKQGFSLAKITPKRRISQKNVPRNKEFPWQKLLPKSLPQNKDFTKIPPKQVFSANTDLKQQLHKSSFLNKIIIW